MGAQMSTSHLSCSLGRANLYLAQPLRGEDAFPTGCRGGREMIIIIIINDVQDLVSTCLYKHQIISSVPALKLPRAVSFLLFSQPMRSSQRHGLFWKPTRCAWGSACCKVGLWTRRNKRFWYFQPIFIFPCVTCKAMPSTRLQETNSASYWKGGWVFL